MATQVAHPYGITTGFQATTGAHSFVIQNPTAHPVLSWVPTTFSFPKGERTDLVNLGLNGRPYFWEKVIKRWDDGSIALAQMKSAYYLNQGQLAMDELVQTTQAPVTFTPHPELSARLAQFLNSQVTATCQGNAVACSLVSGNQKIVNSSTGSITLRYRNFFHTQTVPMNMSPLTMTSFVTINSLDPIIQVTIVVGNDSLENVFTQGLQVNNIAFDTGSLPNVLFHSQSYQGMSMLLGDAQTAAFRYYVNLSSDPVYAGTMSALHDSLFVGLELYEAKQATSAFLTGAPLPNARFPVAQTIAVHGQVESTYQTIPSVAPKTYLGRIDQNPAQTGAQADFCSTAPAEIQKCLQAYSQSGLSLIMTAVMRESYRPSFFWKTTNGVTERPTLVDYPNLFFWSSRPHTDPTWNSQYPEWLTRCRLNFTGLDGWGGDDNQHWQANHLRSMYELTGDAYLGDVLRYYATSVIGWDFFTRWESHIEAERGCRTMKEAYALCQLFKGTPEVGMLAPLVQQKGLNYDASVSAIRAQYGIAGCSPFNACDPRVPGQNDPTTGQPINWCPVTVPPTTNAPIVCVAWQVGFHLEWEWLRATPDMRYLDDAHTYFLADGTPKIYMLFTDPNQYTTGGIGIQWLSPWIMLAQKYPNHPNSPFILTLVKQRISVAIEANTHNFFSDQDGWRSFT